MNQKVAKKNSYKKVATKKSNVAALLFLDLFF